MTFAELKRNKDISVATDDGNLEVFQAPYDKRVKLLKDLRSFLKDDGYWRVHPLAFNEIHVFIVCPHCGNIHDHGRGGRNSDNYAGHRVSHCADRWCQRSGKYIKRERNNGYIITKP